MHYQCPLFGGCPFFLGNLHLEPHTQGPDIQGGGRGGGGGGGEGWEGLHDTPTSA